MSDQQQPPPPPNDPQQPYQPYPQDSARQDYEAYASSLAVERPPSITTAVMLMRAGAALAAIYVVITLLMLGTLKDDIRTELANQDKAYTQSDLDTAYNVAIAFVVVIGILGVVLWLWMAAMNGKGKNWARITATVLAGLNIVFSLLSLAGTGANNPSAVGLIYTILNLVIAVAALFYMYRKDSNAYYAAMSRRR